ncbi:hypothetical protein A2V49_03320 [candidate division WWE3 bacterium RBG_19FT_COMBO_34_6]|uniref:Peptidase M50 domain-containing protein n=1 Tax=candidate division WWE3 bacterium RBG_19FT_COMBO_34_6 TaxID=1802612 RepID=A0A1F4UKQ4_UNCKA|nr:MAG: hypothetical protein A2V49_03320 [candidate division WWE3 bacterium RBG_19FT_COMBO_34_6]
MLIKLLSENPAVFFAVVAALIISISIHEFAHAFTAEKLGDSTPRYMGRVTLDPRAHLDPVGTLLLVFAGFGWGKPVLFNPINLKNPKRDAALIAFAGPFSNLALALVLSVIFHLFSLNSNIILGGFLYLVIFYNIILGIFNLLPVHPLDGFKVVSGLLPQNLYFQWMQMERYGVIILMLLILTRSTGVIVTPFVNILLHLFRL